MQIKEQMRESDGDVQELVITMTASADEVDASMDAFFGQIAERQIDGFRKGKAPRSVLENQVGGHERAMGGVAETLINEHALKAIDDAGVIFINEPTFNVEGMIKEHEPFTFTVSGQVSPKIGLSSYDPVSISLPPEKATEKEIDDLISNLQDYYHTFQTIDDPDHTAQMGDYVMAKMTITNHGKIIAGIKDTSRVIGLGEGTMPDSFDENLIGAKAGDVLEFDFEAKDEEGNSEYGDGDLHANVEIKEFRKLVVPELNDEFAAKVGCENVDEMRKSMKLNIEMEKAKALPEIKLDRCVEALVQRVTEDIPEYYVNFIKQDVIREFIQSLDQQGMNLQQWMLQNSVAGDDMKDDMTDEAIHRAKIDCAFEALYENKGLEITDADIDALFENDENPEDIKRQWEEANRMANVRKMARQKKVTDWLVDNAEVIVEEQ